MHKINDRTREMLNSSTERLAELSVRWAELKVHYRGQVDALKKDYAHKTDEKWQEACHALEEMRREVKAAFQLLDRLPAVA